MNLFRKSHIIISILIFITIISIAAYVKSTSIVAEAELQKASQLAVNKKAKQLEAQQILEKQQELEQKKLYEDQKKLATQKKVVENKKVEAQKKQEEIAKKQLASSKNKASSTSQAKLVVPPTVPKPKFEILIDRIKGKGNALQAIVVTTNGFGRISATIITFENINGTWKQINSFAGNIGRSGFIYNKREGDGHTPIGVFSLGTAFGRYSNPGTSKSYRQSTSNDFWVDDTNSSLYNTWQKGPVNGRWNSAEKMYIPQYNYGFEINYNTTQRIPGKGSAIFFHIWSGQGSGTAGCISAAQNNVTNTLKWLKPSKHPVIIQGPMSEVVKM